MSYPGGLMHPHAKDCLLEHDTCSCLHLWYAISYPGSSCTPHPRIACLSTTPAHVYTFDTPWATLGHSAPRSGGNSKWLFSYSTIIYQFKWGRNIWITRCKRNFDSNSVTFSDILSFLWPNFFSMDPEFLHFFKYFSENWS